MIYLSNTTSKISTVAIFVIPDLKCILNHDSPTCLRQKATPIIAGSFADRKWKINIVVYLTA